MIFVGTLPIYVIFLDMLHCLAKKICLYPKHFLACHSNSTDTSFFSVFQFLTKIWKHLKARVLSISFEWITIILVINLEKFWVCSNNVSYDVEAVGQIIFWSQSSHGLILKGFFRLLWIRIRFAWALTHRSERNAQ